MEPVLLGVFDYVVFVILLLVSLAIGIFYSFRQKTTAEYLHGNRKMTLVPVTISLVVSYISALTMQGLPAEVYMHGIGIGCTILAMWGVMLVSVTFLPIYYTMQPTSAYEYLEARYQSSIPQVIASLSNVLSQTIYCGFILYGPSAAIESMSGIATNYSIIAIAVVCTIYTSLGGLRGVMWTDVFQAVIMVLGFVAVIVVGCTKMSVADIWHELEKHGRTEINFSPRLDVRNSFWICLIFMGIQWHNLFIGQTAMVRYTSLPTERQAKISIILGGLGVMFLIILACTTGAVVFAYYSKLGCGPVASGAVYTSNQVIPYFVVNVVNYPGIPGLFLAATVASTLSSMSSSQTSIVAILWKDVLSCHFKKISEIKRMLIMKFIVAMIGVIAILIAFIAKYAGETLYNMGFAVLDVIGGPVYGMFVLGALFTFPSVWGAMIGCLTSMALVGFITIGRFIHGTTWAKPQLIEYSCHTLLNSSNTTSELSQTFVYANDGQQVLQNGSLYNSINNITSSVGISNFEEQHVNSGLLSVFSVSSYANPCIAIAVTVLVGALISAIPALRAPKDLDRNLFFPFVRRLCRNTSQNHISDGKHKSNADICLDETKIYLQSNNA